MLSPYENEQLLFLKTFFFNKFQSLKYVSTKCTLNMCDESPMDFLNIYIIIYPYYCTH